MRSLRVLIVLSSVGLPALAFAQTPAAPGASTPNTPNTPNTPSAGTGNAGTVPAGSVNPSAPQATPSASATSPASSAPAPAATSASASSPTVAPATGPSGPSVESPQGSSAGAGSTTAQGSEPAPATGSTADTGAAPAPAPEPEPTPDPALPAPAQATGAPNPSALAPSATDEWRFSTHGYFRAPLRVGLAKRPICGGSQRAGDTVDGVPCAGEGQSQLNFHSPFLADDQYLDWRYTRQWERDWTEVFLNFGNSTIVGTVGLQAWNLTDASYNNTDAQLGISQAYVTIKPKLTGRKRFEAKVGSFWNRYGGAGKYDAGKYDTYLYGRTHVMGEVLNGELDVGSFTLRLSHGFGAKTEQKTIGDTSPGFTLLNHVHAGVSYKKLVDLNAHYLVSWAQDGRATPQIPDGQIHVAGVETRITGGVYGEFFAGYSHINAVHAQAVGPGLEVMHSMGGGGVNAANGLVENYFGPCAACKPVDRGSGQVNTVSLQYDYSFGTLWRRLRNPKEGFWGDGSDVTMSLFGMYTQVGSRDEKADGTEKLKFGTDVVYTAMSWMGVGLRADRVMPNSKDSEESFSVVSPKLIFRTKFVTHEEITAQYSKYWYGSKVRPLYPNQAALPDQNVFGIKATMWW